MHQTVFERQPPADSVIRDSLRDSRKAVFWIEGIEVFARE